MIERSQKPHRVFLECGRGVGKKFEVAASQPEAIAKNTLDPVVHKGHAIDLEVPSEVEVIFIREVDADKVLVMIGELPKDAV